jgi:hypothetical protein
MIDLQRGELWSLLFLLSPYLNQKNILNRTDINNNDIINTMTV